MLTAPGVLLQSLKNKPPSSVPCLYFETARPHVPRLEQEYGGASRASLQLGVAFMYMIDKGSSSLL